MSDVFLQSEPDDEPLSWQAFRYISDEMSGQELAAFESRLDAESGLFELAACKAVARAVLLNDAVVAAVQSQSATQTRSSDTAAVKARSFQESPVSARVTSSPERVARRVSILTSAVVVVAVGWVLTTSFSGRDGSVKVVDQPASVQSNMAGELVQFWASSGTELALASSESQLPSTVDVPDMLSSGVPDWLFAAVQSRVESAVGSSVPEVLEN
jgi:hypothetical protein